MCHSCDFKRLSRLGCGNRNSGTKLSQPAAGGSVIEHAEGDDELRTMRHDVFPIDRRIVLVDDFFDDRKPEPRAIGFPNRYKGIE